MKLRPRSSARLISIATLSSLPFIAPAAHAQTAEDQAAARVLFEEGMRLYGLQQYPEACPKFEASLKRYSGIGTRGKLAECYEQIGKTASAWALWSEVAAFSHKNMEPDREAYANEHAKNLEPKLSHLTVTILPANKIAGEVVKRNGEAIDDAALGLAIAVDPGKVVLEATAPDHKPWTQTVDVAPQAATNIEIPALENAPPLVTPPPPAEEAHSNWQKPVGIAGVGVGAAVIVTGGIFGLVASSKWSSAFSEGCNHSNNICTTQQGFDDSHSANTFATLSNIFIIGGVVVAGAGAVLWITAPKTSHNEITAAKNELGVTPIALPGGGAISAHGSF
jgi:hypothetical protein